ncbi:DUF3368 domain-containing protein [Dyadobacter beijingensis]|uniref:DUF3368 domain-containing protein n=1 Tax=Dyadobacter beijingensis TaxID=365489 RepID=A0ABQ2HL15_9BACT|nr:DUF3368 domain-containing protein [Dyadobacter beijingensis]GGM83594.1 DUF3368 domain-containing protein [Dyadobacter beijingensis]
MQKEYEVIIADTSCLILLEKIGKLDLLQSIFGTVTITDTIAGEFGSRLPEWISIRIAADSGAEYTFDLDPGEAGAIAFAMTLDSVLLILDDYKARKVAQRLGLEITGTLGVLLKAKQMMVISSITPILEEIQQTNFRYSQKVFEQILLLANE